MNSSHFTTKQLKISVWELTRGFNPHPLRHGSPCTAAFSPAAESALYRGFFRPTRGRRTGAVRPAGAKNK